MLWSQLRTSILLHSHELTEHRSFVERQIVKEDIGGVQDNEAVNNDVFGLGPAPQSTNELVIFLGRPAGVLENVRINYSIQAGVQRTHDHDKNICTVQVKAYNTDGRHKKHARTIQPALAELFNDSLPLAQSHCAVKLQVLDSFVLENLSGTSVNGEHQWKTSAYLFHNPEIPGKCAEDDYLVGKCTAFLLG